MLGKSLDRIVEVAAFPEIIELNGRTGYCPLEMSSRSIIKTVELIPDHIQLDVTIPTIVEETQREFRA